VLRAALNPGFTAAAVRSYQPVFEKVAQTVSRSLKACHNPRPIHRKLTEELEKTSESSTNICSSLGPATLSAASEGLAWESSRSGSDVVRQPS
jgi:hypothetical protein